MAWWRPPPRSHHLCGDSQAPSLRGCLEGHLRIEIGTVAGRALFVGAGVGLRAVHHGDAEKLFFCALFFFVLFL